MKKSTKFLTGALALTLLTACSDKENESLESYAVRPPTSITTSAESSGKTDVLSEFTKADSVPLLSIITTDTDSLDFITKPVDSCVAKSIASWTPGYVIPPAPYYENCTVTLMDADNSVLISKADAEVKVRGNWTTNYEKKPLRIKFREKQRLLGLNDGAEQRNWILLAEYKDGSMLRNKTALSVSREILGEDGLYAADSKLVEVIVNGSYWGMYLLTEQQQVSGHRVDITEPKDGYTGVDIGYFLEFDGYFSDEDELHSFHADYAGNAPLIPFDGSGGSGRTMSCLPQDPRDPKKDVGFTIKSEINSREQHDFIANFVDSVYRIMYSAAYENKALVFDENYENISETTDITPQEAVERVVDVRSLADMYIISELTCDADIYWSSFYMDADFGQDGDRRLRFEAPWDFDSALGNKERCPDGTGFYAANIVPDVNGGTEYGLNYETINPWLAVIIYEDWFQELIREKWTSIYDNGTFDRAYKMIEQDTSQLSFAFERNYSRWNNITNNADFSAELSKEALACKDFREAASYLNKWLHSRVEFLNSNWHN